MTDIQAVELARFALMVSAKVAGPFLVASLVLGTVIGLFQAATQVHEMTISFVPKLAAMALIVVISGGWMLNQLIEFTKELYDSVPSLLG